MTVDGYAVNRDGGLWRLVEGDGSPRNWIVWHFTPVENLQLIAAAGQLQCDRDAQPSSSPGNQEMKNERLQAAVVLEGYPESCVGDHVPFYIAGKSPMLFRVCRYELPTYNRGPDPLVFMGFRLGDLIANGLVWCIADRNATSPFVEFFDDLDAIPTELDMDVLKAHIWKNTPDDPSRATRRAAEVLVHGSVPLDLLHITLARTKQTAALADEALADHQYDGTHVVPWMYY